jgi:hypothetical protein
MTQILQPPDLKAVIQPILDRLAILERQPARAIEIKDSSGVTRIRSGIAPQTNSLAAFDSLGNPLFDTDGLQQVVKRIATQGANSTSSPWSTTYSSIAATGQAFTLTRTATILILCQTAFKGTGGTAPFVYGRIGLTSGSLSFPAIPIRVGGDHVPVTFFQIREALAPGTYTATLWYSMEATGATTTFDTFGTQLDVFRFGA